MSEWISVKDRLPEKDGRYSVFLGNRKHKVIEVDFYLARFGSFGWAGDVTHWAPLLEPPESEDPLSGHDRDDPRNHDMFIQAERKNK